MNIIDTLADIAAQTTPLTSNIEIKSEFLEYKGNARVSIIIDVLLSFIATTSDV